MKEMRMKKMKIKVEVITQFTLARFDELTNIKRANVEKYGTLFVGDTFECSKEMAEYLSGKNEKGNIVVRIIEVELLKENANE